MSVGPFKRRIRIDLPTKETIQARCLSFGYSPLQSLFWAAIVKIDYFLLISHTNFLGLRKFILFSELYGVKAKVEYGSRM